MYSTSENYKNKILADTTKHILNIYINGNKINSNYIFDFNITKNLFNNNEFCLGCTPEVSIEFEIHKNALPEIYTEVFIESGIEEEVIPIGYFTIQSVEKENDSIVTIKAIDNMKKFEDNNYDGSSLVYPATILEVLQDICSKVEVELRFYFFFKSK